MKAYRAALLRFNNTSDGAGEALYEPDGLLVTAPDAQGVQIVQAAGSWTALRGQFGGLDVEHLPGRMIAPGFVDLHLHYPVSQSYPT